MPFDRRQFMAAGALAAGAIVQGRHAWSAAVEEPPISIPLRALGRTGLRAAAIGFGAMECPDSEVIRHALSLGVNVVDTADCYMGGQNEKIVGQAVAGQRDKVIVATKVHLGTEEAMVASIERSLRSLATDYIDLVQVHGVSSASEVESEVAKTVFTKMREKGLIRFVGVTTHGNQEVVLKAVAQGGFYDTVLVAVNFRSPSTLVGAIADAAAKGVGIIAMKTQNGGYSGNPFPGFTPHQASLRHVLDLPGVACAVPGMYTFKMVQENLRALGVRPGPKTGLLLELYREGLVGRACAFCSSCILTCRFGVGGMAAARVQMYLDGYRNSRLALEAGPRTAADVRRCAECPGCTAACPSGIDIRAAAQRARSALNDPRDCDEQRA